MEVVILPSPRDVATSAAGIIAALVRARPAAVLGLATGATQEPVYAELVRLHRDGELDLAAVTTFNLDEFVGLDPGHPASYHRYMTERLLAHVNLSPARVHIPDGRAADLERACVEYEEAIRAAGGIDLQVLGIGVDGHIGFNEPTSSLGSRTRLKTLARATRQLQHGFAAGEPVPRHVLTMGIGTILEARRCLVLASGAHKAAAVAAAVEGPLGARLPASALQLHPRTTVLVDETAAGRLALADYYREVHRHKPDWQRARDGV